MNTNITQDNHRCITECLDNICKCVTDKDKLRDKMLEIMMNSPISKEKIIRNSTNPKG